MTNTTVSQITSSITTEAQSYLTLARCFLANNLSAISMFKSKTETSASRDSAQGRNSRVGQEAPRLRHLIRGHCRLGLLLRLQTGLQAQGPLLLRAL